MDNAAAYISSVRLKNFLSFYDGQVNFDPGMTVIVGPNGSGKTSIFHGLKFALGSNQRELRYSKWSDFIRHGASSAEVEVTIKANGHSQKFLRKIDRDGIPRAYVDGRRVRASSFRSQVESLGFDVDNNLVFMPQERINAIRDMDPIGVRRLIEEGTNLDVLRERISVQEVKVIRDKERLESVLTEAKTVDTELDLLKHDLKRLERKRSLQEQEKSLALESKWAALDDLTNRIDDICNQVERQETGLSKIIEEHVLLQAKIEKGESYSSGLVSKLEKIQIEMGRTEARIEENERNLQRLKGESARRAEELQQLDRDLKAKKRKKAKITDHLTELSEVSEDLCDKKIRLMEGLDETELERNKIDDDLEAFSDWNAKRAEAYGEYRALQAEVDAKDLLCRSLRERLQIEKAELEEIENKWSHIWSIIEQSNEDDLITKKSLLEKEMAFHNEKRFESRNHISKLKEEITDIKTKLSQKSKRVPKSVVTLKYAIEEHHLEHVVGPLVELVSVDDETSIAAEAALAGNLAFAFITDNEAEYNLLEKIRDKHSAPSPIIMLKPNSSIDRPEDIPPGTGVIGWLWDKITLETSIKEKLSKILGNLVLTQNAKIASRIAKRYGLGAVSLDGYFVVPSNSYFVSHPKIESSGILSTTHIRARLEDAEHELQMANRTEERIEADLERISSDRAEVIEILDNMSKWHTMWEKRKALSISVPEIEVRIMSLKDELESRQSAKVDAERKLRLLDNEQPTERSILIGQRSALTIKVRNLQGEISKIDGRLSSNQIEERRHEHILQGLTEEITMLSNRISELREETRSAKGESTRFLNNIEDLKSTLKQSEIDYTSVKEDLGKTRNQIRSLSKQLIEFNLIIKDNRREILQLKRQLSNFQQEKGVIESQIHSLTRPKTVRGLDIVRAELAKIRALLDDYHDVSEAVAHRASHLRTRMSTLVTKVDSLRQEVEEAEITVKDIRDQYHNGMNGTLRKIENEVNSILASVHFPGKTRFELVKIDGEYGVQFRSMIKGDVYKKISAGSGGERSLIAIALILSLQRFNPAPTYALDEIDIFLDATNTELVSQLLYDSSRGSQFILMTPAKSTYLLKQADKRLGVVSPGGVDPSVVIESPKFTEE